MKLNYLFILFILFSHFLPNNIKAQQHNSKDLMLLSEQKAIEYITNKDIAIEYARLNDIPLKVESNGVLKELQFIDQLGKPQYYITHNENAAKTISTDKVYTGGAAGLSLSGAGVLVHEWDGGTVLHTHQEFDSRVTNMDATVTNYHATHVAGTIMASGFESAATGMAFAASLEAYDWDDDWSEMAAAGANGALVSNHSYGTARGWDGSNWNGNESISSEEDYLFGFYNSWTAVWDEIAYNAPYYLMVKSAGNDRNDVGDGSFPPDGPYDCIGPQAIAKNILTVGAVEDIPGAYSGPGSVIATSFSSWGPADDGRIKPDIVANGAGLYSAYNTANDDYATLSGTSMSSPSVTGSVALLIQHYENLNGAGARMKAATVKALIINSADEAGTNIGPDYQFGWGLMNTRRAAEKITEDQSIDVMLEHELQEGGTYTREIVTDGTSPITITIAWTDPVGSPVPASLDPANPMLVNDLDLRVTQGGNTFHPWKLDPGNPSAGATNMVENNVDNVEQVYIASPSNATTYTITIDHDGSLSGGSQAFSLIIDGDISNAPIADFEADHTSPADHTPVQFTDLSVNIPTSWSWSFSPSSVNYLNSTSASSQHPQVEFTAVGTYQVSLTATNAFGSNTETKVGYITVSDSPSGYCEAYSTNPYGDIRRVQMGDIDKTSTNTNVGGADPNDKYYEDWTAYSTDVSPGESYDITISSIYSDPDMDIGIWVDWNRDGDFDDPDEDVLCGINNGAYGTHSISVPSQALLGKTRMRIRLKVNNSDCGNSCGSATNGEVEDYTLRVIGTWTGISNTDWATSANWSHGSVPEASDHLLIPGNPTGGVFPLISSSTTAICADLEIEPLASIQIRGFLTVKGNLTNDAGISGIVIKSDASGTGSLIQSNSSINATFERYIAAWTGDSDGWHFLSSPVAGFNIAGSGFEPGGSDDFYAWDELLGLWKNYKAGDPTQILEGKGYLTAWATSSTKSFSGILNNANKTWSNLSYTPANVHGGWHLLGNPFSSALLWDASSWGRNNVDAIAKIYKENTGAYIDISANDPIPASQGFMVHVSSSNNSITIPLADRSHHAQNWYKDEEANQVKLIAYDLEGNTAQESVIRFHENSSLAYDPEFDSYFFPGFAPYFYSVSPDGNLSTNTLPGVSWSTIIPFSFIKNASSSYTIEAEGIGNLQPYETVYLTDLKLNHTQNLNQQSSYSFSSMDGDIAERFILHFSPLAIEGVEDLQNIKVFASQGQIEVRCQTPIDAEIFVYNVAGQLLKSDELTAFRSASIALPNYHGAAIVSIITNQQVITKKVLVF